MYYINELKEQVSKIRAALAAADSHADSEEFKAEIEARHGKGTDTFPSRLGFLLGAVTIAKSELAHTLWLAEQATPAIALGERLVSLCQALGIDDDNLAALELMVADQRYNSERHDLYERITEAAGEVIADTRERERDNAIAELDAAGFVAVERDDFEGWERQYTIPAPPPTPRMITASTPIRERVAVETKHRNGEFWYEFVLEVNGAETLRGKSGEFGKLLEAVGIKQEVKA